MKIVHVSDLHITGEPIFGGDPGENLELCFSHVAARHRDASLVAVTGDLTHWGKPKEYAKLRQLLASYDLPIRLMIGNHDNRTSFQDVFPAVPRDENGFVQYAEDFGEVRCMFLDTVEPRTHAGHFGPSRQEWLRRELVRAREEHRGVCLFMHHNPVAVGVAGSDAIGLTDGKAFREILAKHRDIVRHVFFGHTHYVLSGSMGGIPFSAPRSTNHQCIPDFSGRPEIGMADLPPTYNVVLIDGEDTVVHSIDFRFDGEVTWVGTAFEDWTRTAAE